MRVIPDLDLDLDLDGGHQYCFRSRSVNFVKFTCCCPCSSLFTLQLSLSILSIFTI